MPPASVLYINHVGEISGAEESLLALIKRIDREAFMPVLACPPGPLVERAQEAGATVHPLIVTRFRRTSNPFTKSTYALAWFAGTNQIRKIIRDVQPRLVHSNSATAHLYAGSVARKAGVACVWHARDLRPLPFPSRTLCRKTDRVIAISEAVADFLTASGLTRPMVTRIYNGLDPEAWRKRVTENDIRARLGLAEDDRVLLMVAQLVPWKRHEDLIRALPHILTAQPTARLVIAGSDQFGDHANLAAEFEALAKDLGVSDKIVYTGQCDDIPNLMAAADMVVIPSDAEPFGRVAIEAMALGKPVVGTRAGGLPEVVRDGETGLLVVPRFPESLAKACVRLLENDFLARNLAEAARKRVASEFHIDRAAKETAALYETMLHPPLKWVPA